MHATTKTILPDDGSVRSKSPPFNRREFLASLGLGVAAIQTLPFSTIAATPTPTAGPKTWIDPRFATLPKRPWRKVHLDFHNSKYVPKIGAAFEAQEFGDRLVVGNVSGIVVFAKDMHGHFYYPSQYGPVHPGLAFDLLGAQVQACRERHIAVYAYYCTTWDNYLADTRREWLVINRDGGSDLPKPGETPGWTALCLAHKDFVALMSDHIKEFVAKYELDGAWLDMAEPVSPECYCPECVKQIKAAGKDPNDLEAQREHKNRLFLDFHRRMRDLVHATRPGCQIDFNDIGLPCVSQRADVLDNIDIEALPTGFWGYYCSPLHIRYQRTFGITTYGLTGRFVASWADFGGLKLPKQLDVELASIVANAARCDVGDQMPPNGCLNPAVYHVLGQSFGKIKILEPWLEGAAPVTEAALIVPSVPLEVMREEYLYGMTKLLIESRLQFDAVEAGQEWERYGLIVLPDQVRLDAATIERLHAFISNGGAVVVCHHAGLSPDGKKTWLDRYGFEYCGDSPFTPAYLVPLAKFTRDIPSYEYALYDGASQWKAQAPAASLAGLGEPLFQRSAVHYTSHAQSPFDHLTDYTVLARSGRVAVIGFPLGQSYYQKGYWIYRAAFEEALRQVRPERLLETNAPLSTELTVTHQTADAKLGRRQRYLIHLINWSSTRKAPPHPEMYEDPIPLTNVKIRLNLPLKFGTVRSAISGEKLRSRHDQRGIEVPIPRIEINEVVTIEVS